MERKLRPLSPHMQIYKPQLTSIMSILHRIMGVSLSFGSIMLVWWLFALAAGPADFSSAQSFFGSWFGLIILFGFSFALFYHLCNGIRHLVWDTVSNLEIKQVYNSGWAVIIATFILTAICWGGALWLL
jgi:succinate dehydrogenase cytochrome b subunit